MDGRPAGAQAGTRRSSRATRLRSVTLTAGAVLASAVSIGGCANSRHAVRGHVRLATFTACVTHSHLVVLAHSGRKTGLVVTIKDRGGDTVVGEVSEGRPSQILGGAAAGDGRLTMSTATPIGRSAGIIERCWDHFSPIAPNS